MSKSAAGAQELAASTNQEDDLIRQAQRDPARFQDVYRNWVGRVYQFVYARTYNQQDAEDLTAQIFMQAYQALPRYQHRGHFPAWLFTIARNQVNGFYRSRQTQELPIETAEQAGASPDMLKQVIQIDEIRRLSDLIQALPAEEQELIHLRYVAELKFADIALVVDRSEEATKKALYRLQERLQAQLEADHE